MNLEELIEKIKGIEFNVDGLDNFIIITGIYDKPHQAWFIHDTVKIINMYLDNPLFGIGYIPTLDVEFLYYCGKPTNDLQNIKLNTNNIEL